MDSILFIDAAVRESSRTRALAAYLAERLNGAVTRLALADTALPALDAARLDWRTDCCARGDFSGAYFDFAKQFAAADAIVIAAPYWDGSFPALLKQYLETICVTDLTFRYTQSGAPQGLCRAKALWYVTTAGGTIFDDSFGYGYVRALAQGMFGIPETHLIKAEGLDIVGADEGAILAAARAEIDRALAQAGKGC